MINFQLKQILDNFNAIQDNKITINKLSKETGISRTSLRGLYNGTSKGIQFETLNKLIEYFDISLDNIINYYNKIEAILIYKLDINQIPKQYRNKHNKDSLNNLALLGLYDGQNMDDVKVMAFPIPKEIKNREAAFTLIFDSKYGEKNPLKHLDVTNTKRIISIIIYALIDLNKYNDNQKIDIELVSDKGIGFTNKIYTINKSEIIKNSKFHYMEIPYQNSNMHFTVINKIRYKNIKPK